MKYLIKYGDDGLPEAMATKGVEMAKLLGITPGTVSYYKKVGKIVEVEIEEDEE